MLVIMDVVPDSLSGLTHEYGYGLGSCECDAFN